MNILALDLGTNTGWAIENKSIITSGTISFKNNRYEGGGMRYLRFTKWLQDTLLLINNIDAIYFEEVRRHLGVDAAHTYGGFMSQLTSFGELNKIPYLGIPVGTIKKYITGKGNASKQQMIEAVKSLGHHPKDDNEADAIALLYTVKSSYGN